MQLVLEQYWADKLLTLPESGMGYQRVRVRLKDGRTVEHATVLNAQVLQVDDTFPPFTPSDIIAIELEPARTSAD